MKYVYLGQSTSKYLSQIKKEFIVYTGKKIIQVRASERYIHSS